VKAPPSNGPTTEEIPNILDNRAIYMARFLKGTENPMMVIPPEKRAAAPAPATARPTMSMVELVAAAHKTEPASKMMIALM
jgi:hypothetical protein